MIIKYHALPGARTKLQYNWCKPLWKQVMIPADLLSIGFRLMFWGLATALVAFPISVLFNALGELSRPLADTHTSVYEIAWSVSMGAVVLSAYAVLFGKLLSFFAPTARRLVGAYWATGFGLVVLGALLDKEAICALSVILSNAFFFAFLLRLARHYQWTLAVLQLKRTMKIFGLCGVLGLLAAAVGIWASEDVGACLGLASVLTFYAGQWSYAMCLHQASKALRVDAKPFQFRVMLQGLWSGLKHTFLLPHR